MSITYRRVTARNNSVGQDSGPTFNLSDLYATQIPPYSTVLAEFLFLDRNSIIQVTGKRSSKPTVYFKDFESLKLPFPQKKGERRSYEVRIISWEPAPVSAPKTMRARDEASELAETTGVALRTVKKILAAQSQLT